MKLKIAFYSPETRLPVHGYGGTERVLGWLDQGLRSLGHDTYLWVHPDSEISNRVDHFPEDVDLVHFFDGLNIISTSKPWIYTQHGNAEPSEKLPLNTVFISKDHASRHGSSHFVYNGVNPDDYVCKENREHYACFLGKAKWKVKNLKGAIQVAQKSKIKLHILGGRGWPFRKDVWYHGIVDQKRKVEFLSSGQCLINPVRWHEPFGLAMVESLLSGMAVFGTPYGALPEIVSPEVGTLSYNASELASAIIHFNYDPLKYRDYASSYFNHIQMAQNYVSFYERVLNGEVLHAQSPELINTAACRLDLPWE